ncbi:DUF4129 domain-containing protein [Microbacterium sp. ET2]|uniref:DUF4129 domain-containing protein n=1 Tax=Microbacterium albipurpureum TaxID=3050384 RepID=UPI00259CF2FD|nr:DUF4129 domain-containing protein [Microbacterium sp. ET2 (Ac-2212)]WJL95128.1 DUF4129 domain-containing protein [Microbacterium sp. ET2 (Ac-2212)]
MISGVARMLVATPVTPDGDEAREWAERELSNPVYAEAEPTAFDRIARAIGEFLGRLFSTDVSGGLGSTFALVAAIAVAALIIVAVLVWGLPRARRRAAAPVATLFGDSDERSADDLRRAAASAAAAGDWDEALILRFRALARGLAERGVVSTPPGATVHAFARSAGRVFPSSAADLEAGASAFDDVRYLRRPGSRGDYEQLSRLDEQLIAARPATPVRTGMSG